MNLSGCDKVVLKNSISGSRFVVSWPLSFYAAWNSLWFLFLFLVNDLFFGFFLTEHERKRPAEIPQTSRTVSSDISSLIHTVGHARLLLILLSDPLAYFCIRLNDSEWCLICASGWFPRSALRSARRRKEGYSERSRFQIPALSKIRPCVELWS